MNMKERAARVVGLLRRPENGAPCDLPFRRAGDITHQRPCAADVGDVRRRRAAVCTSYAMPPARIGLSASGTTTELRTSVHFDAVQAGRHDCGTHDRVVSECVVDTSTSDASSAAA